MWTTTWCSTTSGCWHSGCRSTVRAPPEPRALRSAGRGGRGFVLELLPVQARVDAAVREQLGVGASLDDSPAVDDEDDVRRQDGGQAVGDGQRGAASHQRTEGFLDQPLGGGVQG